MENDKLDETYIHFKNKIETIKKDYPLLSNVWLHYLKKHTMLFKKVLNDIHFFTENVYNLPDDLNENNILMLYFILNNNININN